MADENTITPDDVEISDLVKVEFPRVNENAVRAVAENEKPKSENGDLRGYNPEIHESPPRKNKFGEWAKKRGNKKGCKVAEKTNPEKPALEIPENEIRKRKTRRRFRTSKFRRTRRRLCFRSAFTSA